MRGILLKKDDEIRYLLLYSKEKLLHEDVSEMETYMIPDKFITMPDCERRGFIRALRWVAEELDDELR
tara:strand:+ start:3191 stop:3394 length:204 start_codon:yes stop_codon:yes gene_type:complete